MRENTRIEVTTILGLHSQQAIVELTINDTKVQMPVDKAREVVLMLHAAIEAAISDKLIWEFLKQKIGLDDGKAAAVMVDFRELRQGSKSIVYPN